MSMAQHTLSKRSTLALALLVLSSGCAFETESVGSGNGDLYGSGTDFVDGDGGVGDGGLDTGTPSTGVPDGGTATQVIIGEGQCTPGTERSSCPGTSCDPVTLTCTELALASRTTCETCFTDSNCADLDHRCVWMTYYGEPFPDERTGFCLKMTDEAGTGCPPPFVVPLLNRESLSGGKVQSYCGIYEKITTCPAVRAFHNGETCPSGRDDECPAAGLCRGVATGGQKTEYACTYACLDVPECSTPSGKVNCAGLCGG